MKAPTKKDSDTKINVVKGYCYNQQTLSKCYSDEEHVIKDFKSLAEDRFLKNNFKTVVVV